MNRRELLKTFAALPAVKSIEVANVKTDDVVVIECAGRLSRETKEQMVGYLRGIWPENKCLVLDHGLRMRIVRS